jgi:cysteine desulfurase
MAKTPMYFDNHATTPVDPQVLEAMLPYLKEHFGNPESSQHPFGWKAKSAVESARKQVAALINAEPGEIVFTSGATESIHLAILGFLEEQPAGRHIITATTEHKATLEVCARAQKLGHECTVLAVDAMGRITVDQVKAAIRPTTAIVSLMHANNEIGTLHPITEIGAMLKEQGITFHVDAAQTPGRTPIDVRAMNIDLLSISAHKLYGPKGVGALFVRRSTPKVPLAPYIVGGGQERGLRGGTHNVPGIVGLGVACQIATEKMNEECPRLLALRNRIIEAVTHRCPNVLLNGDPENRLCNNVNFSIRGVAPDSLLMGLGSVAYSSGSACSSGTGSHVIKALGQDTSDPLMTTVRLGLGRFNTEAEVETLIEKLIQTIEKSKEVPIG